jgi:hypothetical protein
LRNLRLALAIARSLIGVGVDLVLGRREQVHYVPTTGYECVCGNPLCAVAPRRKP